MRKLLKSRRHIVGRPPGELIYVGEPIPEEGQIEVIAYDRDRLEVKKVSRIEDAIPLLDANKMSWVNINGLQDVALVAAIGRHFGIHELVLEDVVNTGQRPKFEDHGEYIYVVLKMLYHQPGQSEVTMEQVSLLLGERWVLTFQERSGDVFEPVRKRLRESKSRVRRWSADYLAYALVDVIVDHYYLVFELLGERLERLEDAVMEAPKPETLEALHATRRELIYMRKAIWPLRELVADMQRSDSPLIRKETRRFIADTRDHTLQILDTMELFRDTVAGLQDIYLSQLSNRMNEVMKMLTIIATLFIPLTFIAGIYGMNFEYMPELRWRGGYPAAWIVMLLIAGAMLVYFRKKRWI